MLNLADVPGVWEVFGHIPKRPFSQIVVDSRLVVPRALFFALAGARTDGHRYLAECAQNGAVAAVVKADYAGPGFGLLLLRVPDPLLALQDLARKALETRGVRVIGVTGSIGKTTTKEYIATLLAQKYRVGKSPGNANSQVGVPMAILHMDEGIEVMVLEMGMSARGHIARLVEIAPPEVGVLTAVGMAHAAKFASLEEIAQAKAEIFGHPKMRVGVVGRTAWQFSAVHAGARVPRKRVALDGEEGDLCLYRRENQWLLRDCHDQSALFSLPFSAAHLRDDFVIAALVAREMKLSMSDIVAGVQELPSALPRRFSPVEKGGVLWINDTYNASPEAVYAALENFGGIGWPKGRGKKIAVLGEMRELGAFSAQCHQEVGVCASRYVDVLLCFGEESVPMAQAFARETGKLAQVLSDFEMLQVCLQNLVCPGDVVLVKGAHALSLWQLIE